ncbi:MAG TPA: hypothetical protein VG943_15940 [Caulobacterales bacterium]|nr:hypothetical protein [Caulobacterales bacterium]
MRALAMSALAALCLSAAPAHADEPLATLAFFQGCWRGDFGGQNGVTDDRCFAPMLHGKYVRDTHEVRNAPAPYAGETIYYLDAQTHRIGFTYYASDGGISRGFAEPGEGGGLVFPPGEYVGADGSTLTMRARWTPDGPDRYVAVAEIEDHGVWREHLRISYRRAPDLAPPG